MCMLIENGYMMVGDGESMKSNGRHVTPGNFFRVLGGSIEKGETAEEAVRRELREEINMEIENLEFLKVVENIFTYAGEKKHEIVFMFKGKPSIKNLDKDKVTHVIEEGYEFDIKWVKISELLNGPKILYPATDYKQLLSN